ncbi:MAG: 16S rRNA (cytidine(1402)-2'-O)-methyltransferase [Candidatus Symbiobacter sp.]|nr:16S rRNA (cytidine(1402)-2'-O)-methyltransferase [Candidatus Symbiobacter sp.]
MKNKPQIDTDKTDKTDKTVPPSPVLTAGLFLVSTPIGNLADLSARAITVMRGVDLLACEDTRVTAKLCQAYGIATRRIRYDAHKAARLDSELVAAMQNGARVALVADAGTPLISDPGLSLVQACIAAAIPVTPIPGASSILAALVAAGFAAMPFTFLGFAERKPIDLHRQLTPFQQVPTTLILFDSPHRMGKNLARILGILGDRSAVIGRELTKKFEQFHRGTLSELAAEFGAHDDEPDHDDDPTPNTARGEMVLVIAPAAAVSPAAQAVRHQESLAYIDSALRQALATLTPRAAIAKVTQDLALPRRLVYAQALALQALALTRENASPPKENENDDDS